MPEYQLEVKQLVSYPRCRIYREFIQTVIADRGVRTGGRPGLFCFSVLCSYANFRTSYLRLDGISYTVYPGEWICRVGELTQVLRLRFHRQTLDVLDAFQERHLIQYSLLCRGNLVKYKIVGWHRHNTVLDYNCPCQKETGFFFLPVVTAAELVSAVKCSEMDILLDLWISAVYRDEQVHGSFDGPVAYLRNGTGSPLVSYAELAQRWGLSKATVGRVLRKLEEAGHIALLTFPGRHGTAMKLRYIKHLPLCLVLALALTVGAFASPVPDNLVVENLNGQQRVVKTYVLPPDADPEVLKEPPFDFDGFSYTWAYTTKDEHTFLETKNVTETVTVETGKKDLNVVLEQLAPSIPYDDGEFSGELALDHTTLSTVAAGYASKSGKVTATKTIGPLDRNDMSYVPATTVKDGKTLSLVNVEWQVIGTDLVGDVLAPSCYQAVATYSASTSHQVATGYVTTAEYKGKVVSQGVDSITYTVVYVGMEIVPEEPTPTEPTESTEPAALSFALPMAVIGGALLAALLSALAGGGVCLFLRRKNVYVYVPGDRPRDYRLIAKFRVEPSRPEVDIRGLEPYPDCTVAVEIKRPLAKKLVGQTFTVHHRAGDYAYAVLRDRPADWHEFDPAEQKEDII